MRGLQWVACASFVAACAASYPIAAWGAGGEARVGTWSVLQMGFATLCMLGAWWAHPRDDGRAIQRLLVTGLVARLLLVPAWPYTSNDAQRYLWDGRVALEGLDPYTLAPEDEALRGLREVWATPPEHAHLPTLYPPAALAVFSLAAMAGPEHALFAWKLTCAVVSCALLWVASSLLRLYGRTRHLALVALSPLLVLEIGLAAHVDAFSALAIALALWASAQRRDGLAGVAIGVGVLFKLLPGVLLLPLAVAARGRRRVALVCGAASSVAAGYLAAFTLGLRPIGSLGFFLENWRFGSPLASAVEQVVPEAWVSRVLGGLLAVGLLLVAAFARRSPLHSLQAALAVPLLASPVVFPWYLCALAPVVALAPSGFLIAWLATHPLTYEVLDGFTQAGVWAPATWPLLAIGVAWMAGLAWDRRPVRRATCGI